MKKTSLIALILGSMGLCLHAQNSSQGIYQLADPGFEQYTSGNEPGNGWNSFASATGSMASMGKGMSPNPESIAPGANGSQRAVQLHSQEVGVAFFKANANGNLTTGIINMGSSTPSDPSNHNFTNTGDPTHSLKFAGRPDKVVFYAKFKAGAGNAKKVASANFILHDNCNYKDPEVNDQKGNRIGKASFLIPESENWIKYEVPFVYDKAQTETQYLLASITTNPVAGGSVGDVLGFDEVRFVYYHSLSALSYDGVELTFDENTLTYDLSSIGYKKGNLHYTVKGAGATVEEHFNAETGLLTLTVKGNDCSQNPESQSSYQLQFNPEATADLEPALTDLSALDMNSTYALYNEHFTTYASYHPEHNEIWSTNMTGDADHTLHSEAYAQPFQVLDEKNCWMVIPTPEGKYYLYNLAAKKFLKTPGYTGQTSPCTYSESPVALTVVDLGEGHFALTATGHENDYLCAAPSYTTSPIAIWTQKDPGAAWQFKKNPNVAADRTVIDEYYTPALGETITDLTQLDIKKTYVIKNEHFSAYAIYAPEFHTEYVWTAEMKGNGTDHQVKNENYSKKVKLLHPNSSWMIIPQEKEGFYVYNVGAKKYLSTPIETKEDVKKNCFLKQEPTLMYITSLGDGKFALTTSKDPKDYMCAAPQLETPVSNWSMDDPGAAWEFTENPNVTADAELVDEYTKLPLGEKVTELSQIDLSKTYIIRNPQFSAAAIYAPEFSEENPWVAGAVGDDSHHLDQPSYGQPLKVTQANSSWMIIPQFDGFYVYNLGAKKFLSTPQTYDKDGDSKPCYFSSTPVKMNIQAAGDGKFTLTASNNDYDFMCTSIQMNRPISNWTKDEKGAQWEFIVNPNVAADAEIQEAFKAPELGKEVTDLAEISAQKTYVIYNEHFTTSIIYRQAFSTEKVAPAGMSADATHPVSQPLFSQKADISQNYSSWMIVPEDDHYLIYNLEAKKFLGMPTESTENNCRFSEEPVELYIVPTQEGMFNITATKKQYEYLCAAPHQTNAPITNYLANDPGAAWQIIENPNVKVDPAFPQRQPGTAQLTELKVNGTSVAQFKKDHYQYTVTGEYTEGCITFTCEDGANATVKVSYDAESRTASVAVTAKYGKATHTYTVKFEETAPTITKYEGEMVITMGGSLLAQTVDTISIVGPKNNLVDLQLLNFELEGMGNLGNIYISGVPYQPETNGNVVLHKEQNIVIEGQGAALGELPTILDGKIEKGQLTCTIQITWSNIPIVVTFSPKAPVGIDHLHHEGTTMQKVCVYGLNGQLIRQQVKAAEALEGLPAGVYIVNGKKIMK